MNYPEDGTQRSKWFFQYPAQNVLTVDQIQWTANASEAIQRYGEEKSLQPMQDFLDFTLKQINSMVGLVRSDLESSQRVTMGCLIVMDVHGRDVISKLIDMKIDNLHDFEWTKQLRYYWEVENDECFIR